LSRGLNVWWYREFCSWSGGSWWTYQAGSKADSSSGRKERNSGPMNVDLWGNLSQDLESQSRRRENPRGYAGDRDAGWAKG